MGGAGRERVRAVLAWEHSAPVLLAAYDRLWATPLAAASSTWTPRRPRMDRVLESGREPQGTAGCASR